MMTSTAQGGAAGSALLHGGRLTEARRLFPGAPEPFVDLSTGINPVPYPVPDLPAEMFARLPEPEALEALQTAAASAYGTVPAMVVAAPGTQALINLLPRLLPQREVAVLGPTYAEHAASWRAAGSHVTEVARFEDLEKAAPCAVLCNPNNPDGRLVPPAALSALADRLAGRGGLVVVDEAFADFEGEVSVVPALPHPALVVLRSFGKAYGLAGLRLGFALADARTAGLIRAALGPWVVSGPAIAIGCRALLDRVWVADAAARLKREAADLDRCLAAAGLRVLGGTRLFRLAEGAHAAALFQQLGTAGILVRRFPAQPRWLRFGIPGQSAEWDRLRVALRPGCI
jgi:cobalamin biosynthetic protein CobC